MNRRGSLLVARVVGRLPLGRPARFMIVCAPRSGSELLVDLLDAQPAIRCEGELFQSPAADPLAIMAGKAALARRDGALAWGCKILDQQLRWHEDRFGGAARFFERATRAGWLVVHLGRRDLLAQALSALHAEQHQHHYEAGAGASFEPIDVDPVEVIAWMRLAEANAAWLAEQVAPFAAVTLTYEDDLVDAGAQQTTVATICERLDVPAAPVAARLERITPADISARVRGWDELRRVLEATRYRCYLPDSDA